MKKDTALSVAMPTIRVITMGMLMWGTHVLTAEPANACSTCSSVFEPGGGSHPGCVEPGPGSGGASGCIAVGDDCSLVGDSCEGDPIETR